VEKTQEAKECGMTPQQAFHDAKARDLKGKELKPYRQVMSREALVNQCVIPASAPEVHEDFDMTLRDWFAGKALNGCLAYSFCNESTGNYHENCDAEGVAMKAYEYADAMLRVRSKT
jgi:hypothetical protein